MTQCYGVAMRLMTAAQWADDLVRYGATRADLLDLGLSDTRARQLLNATTTPALAPTDWLEIPLAPEGLDLVALVPSSGVARRYWGLGVYLRDAELRFPVRLCAAYVATDSGGVIESVRPITRRLRIGSAAALTGAGPLAAQVAQEPDVLQQWPAEATYVELGPPITLGLRTGFRPNPRNPDVTSALQGPRHRHLADLQKAVQSGRTLRDVP